MRLLKAITLAASLFVAAPALAAGDAHAPPLPDARFGFNSLFGTFDREMPGAPELAKVVDIFTRHGVELMA